MNEMRKNITQLTMINLQIKICNPLNLWFYCLLMFLYGLDINIELQENVVNGSSLIELRTEQRKM